MKTNYSTVNEFVEHKFKNLSASTTLLTSFVEDSTIAGENSILVLSQTKGLSGLIRSVVENQPSIKVISQTSGDCAVVMIIKKSARKRKPVDKFKTWQELNLDIGNEGWHEIGYYTRR
jgi:ABC-type Fe2+-enterobactin transport system substrate-binding protein